MSELSPENAAIRKVVVVHPDDINLACWCGGDHRRTDNGDPTQDLNDALTTLGHEVLAGLRLPRLVDALDRLLRRWPWLYRRLGGSEG